jgi:hypothetical protein
MSLRGGADTLTFIYCCFDSSAYGVAGAGISDGNSFIGCLFSGNTNTGFYHSGGYCEITESTFSDNLVGINSATIPLYITNNIFCNPKTNTQCVMNATARSTIVGNVFDGTGKSGVDGVKLTGLSNVRSNRFINLDSALIAFGFKFRSGKNHFYNNNCDTSGTAAEIANSESTFNTGDDDGIVNRAANNYNLKVGAAGIDSVKYRFTE